MKKQSNGFTLLEAIMVLAILAVMMIAAPPMLKWLGRQGVGHAVSQLQADLRLARMMAISRQRTCTVQFNQAGDNQYQNLLDGRRRDLSVFRGGVQFLGKGPDGMKMDNEITFNRRGMSNTIVPIDIFVTDRERSNIYRLRVLLPGGVVCYRWQEDHWQ